MTTSIKIDFDDDGNATHVRVNGVLLPGATCDLSKLNGLLAAIDSGAGAPEVVAGVEEALAANQVTLEQAARHKRNAVALDELLATKRAQRAEMDVQLAEAMTVKAIVDKRAPLDALTRDVADVVAIVDKRAEIASLEAAATAKAEEIATLDAAIATKGEPALVEEPRP